MADDTLARMFWSRVERSADRPAQQFKQDGAWQTLTWRQMGEIVRELALGLIALGRPEGATRWRCCRPAGAEWVQADFAIFSAGVRHRADLSELPAGPGRLRHQRLRGADACSSRTPAQLAKALEARDQIPQLEHIVVMAGYEATQPPESVLTWETLRRMGRDDADAHKSTLAERVASHAARGRRVDRVHLGNDGPAQGRRADARQPHRRRSPRPGRRRPSRKAGCTCCSCRSPTRSRGWSRSWASPTA